MEGEAPEVRLAVGLLLTVLLPLTVLLGERLPVGLGLTVLLPLSVLLGERLPVAVPVPEAERVEDRDR